MDYKFLDYPNSIKRDAVLWLTFDDSDQGATALVEDHSDFNNHGTNAGATKGVGRNGVAKSFDGTDDIITVSDSDELDGGSGQTISVWIKILSASPDFERVVTKEAGGTDTWQFFVDTNRKVNWRIYNDVAALSPSLATTTAVSVGVWTYIVVLYDGSETSVYFNGVKDATTKSHSGAVRNGAADITIGDFPELGRELSGTIDEVVIWSRALSTQEIKDLYEGGL